MSTMEYQTGLRTKLAIFKRLCFDQQLFDQISDVLEDNTFVLGFTDDNTDTGQAFIYITREIQRSYKTYGKSTTVMSVCASLEKCDTDSKLSPEVKGKILFYAKLIECVLLDRNSREIAERIDSQSRTDILAQELLAQVKNYMAYAWHANDFKPAVHGQRELESSVKKFEASLSKLQFESKPPMDFNNFSNLLMDSENVDLSHSYLPLGIKTVDDALNGGCFRGTLTGFMALSGIGKSQMATHLVAECIRNHMRVHIAVLEDQDRVFGARLVAAVSGLETNAVLKYGSLSPENKEKFAKAIELINKWVVVDTIYGKGIEFVHSIAQRRIDAVKTHNMNCINLPDRQMTPENEIVVSIVDYTGHVANMKRGDKGWEKMREAYAERKTFALSNNIIAFDFIQMNREGSKKSQNDIVTRNDIAGGFDIVQVFDLLISINRSDVQKNKNEAVLYIDKSRSGAVDGQRFLINTDYAHGRFDFSKCVSGENKDGTGWVF